jgi:hypothetical protein
MATSASFQGRVVEDSEGKKENPCFNTSCGTFYHFRERQRLKLPKELT